MANLRLQSLTSHVSLILNTVEERDRYTVTFLDLKTLHPEGVVIFHSNQEKARRRLKLKKIRK